MVEEGEFNLRNLNDFSKKETSTGDEVMRWGRGNRFFETGKKRKTKDRIEALDIRKLEDTIEVKLMSHFNLYYV